MNYPTEFEKMLEEQEAKGWLKHKKKHRCLASENGGCFCTGRCEGKAESTESDQMIYEAGDKP